MKVLKDIKRFTVDQDDQFKTIQKLVDNKIYVKSMYMFGNPEDDENTIKNTINYSMQLPNQLVQYSVFTPYPGTPSFEEYKNKIIVNKFEKYDQHNLIYEHKVLSQKNIRYLLGKAYTLYYARLNWFFKFLKNFIFA